MVGKTLRYFFLFFLVGLGLFTYGFILGDSKTSSLERLVTRLERKVNDIRGVPSEKARALEHIESTFIRFSGSLYELPKSSQHFERGGGIGVWGETLFLVDRKGGVYRFEDGLGIVETAIETPEHGDEDYAEFALQPSQANAEHHVKTLRYNDILFVEVAEFRGLIVSYTFFDQERICYGNRLAGLPLGPDIDHISEVSAKAEDWDILFETKPCLDFRPNGIQLVGVQAGGRMELSPDGRLILSVGDFGFDGMTAPDIGLMNPEVSYGKVLAIDLASGMSEVLSSGHRNIQGVALDADGRIWTVEHAERGGDELNLIEPGENHGWPRESLGTLYSGQPFPTAGVEGRHDIYDPPVYAWLPSAGTSALTFIENFHPAWDGGFVVGSLSSPVRGNALFHVRIEDEAVVFAERIRLGRRVRDVVQYGDKLAVWLDQTDLLILTQEERLDPLAAAIEGLEANHPAHAESVIETLKSCNQCHSYEQNVHGAGPTLNGILGRPVAASGFVGYSDALLALGGVWDKDRLKAYLVDPDAVASGTSMQSSGLTEGPRLDALIAAFGYMDTANAEHLEY